MIILYTEEAWANSQLSIARHYGGINIGGRRFIIVDKLGRDLWECSAAAEREGRDKAIEPGEPADLIRDDFQKLYRKHGRERFIKALETAAERHLEISNPKDLEVLL